MIALLAACAQGSGCAAGKGASSADTTESAPKPAKAEPAAKDEKVSKPSVPLAQDKTVESPVVIERRVPEKPVRDGTPPIVYLLPADGALRVVDKTAGQDVASVPAAKSRSILRIDDLTGITLGQQTLVKGPLSPPGHEYEIYLTTGSENTVRQGITTPGR
jgi:hypothetical protein